MKKIVWQWEKIDDNTARVKVLGGWVVLHIQQTYFNGEAKKQTNVNVNNSESMIFIPDQDWQWQPIEPYVEPQIKKNDLAKDFKA